MTHTKSDKIDPAASRLVARAGLEPRPSLQRAATHFLARTNKARRIGVWAGFGAALTGVLIPGQNSMALTVAQMCAGYLVGSVVAGLVLERQGPTSTVRRASLVPRTTSSLLPMWARVLPWMTLLPCIASPLLLLGDHPVFTRTVRNKYGTGLDRMAWFSPTTLAAISITAALALTLTVVLEWKLTRTRLHVDDAQVAHLDLVTRALSARATAGSASALGLACIAGLGYLAYDVMRSVLCSHPVGGCTYPYQSWGLSLLVDLSFPLLTVSVLLWAASVWLILPRRLRSGPGAAL